MRIGWLGPMPMAASQTAIYFQDIYILFKAIHDKLEPELMYCSEELYVFTDVLCSS